MNSTIDLFFTSSTLGNSLSALGLLTSIIGFIITIIGIKKTKNAAEAAKIASDNTKSHILKLDSAVECMNAISSLEEVRRLIRMNAFEIIIDRLAIIKKSIITVRTSALNLPDTETIKLQSSISQIVTCEETIYKAIKNGSVEQKAVHLLKVTSNISTALTEILATIRHEKEH